MVEKSSAERGNRTLSEELAVLKSDKESLETGLYEQQQIGQQLEGKKTSLEQDIQVINTLPCNALALHGKVYFP